VPDEIQPNEVLIVDDDADIRETLAELLEGEGYATRGAANGKEALDYLYRRSRAGACVILLDLMMPVMDGFEFRSEQQKNPTLRAIPVVVISAGGRCQQAARDLGALGCVTKPVDLPALLGMIRMACEASDGGLRKG
jgi:CheY-like chemotaxis protein